MDGFEADISETKERIDNKDSLIEAYRKQISAAEVKIREIENGGTIHI